MAVKSRAVTVTDEATRLDSSDERRTAAGRLVNPRDVQSVAVFNNGADTVYLGGDDVTVANGCPVPAGTWGPGLDIDAAEELYGIAAAAEVEVRVLEVSL